MQSCIEAMTFSFLQENEASGPKFPRPTDAARNFVRFAVFNRLALANDFSPSGLEV
jgi:hypothetical protein